MSRFVLVFVLIFLDGCAKAEWTERFQSGGFLSTYVTSVKYEIGGPTTFKVNISSTEPSKLKYPVTLKVYLNGSLCSEPVIQSEATELLAVLECSSSLGPGMHLYEVVVSNPNNFSNLTEKEDIRINSIKGSFTYTLEN